MAHEIETNGGQAAFASARESAWHRLGTVVDHTMTPAEVLDVAHLSGWNVRKRPVYCYVGNDAGLTEVRGQYAMVRDNPFTNVPESMGVTVGERYQPIQNEETADLLGTVTDEFGAAIETAGSVKRGRLVFVNMKLPRHMTFAGDDRTDLYVTAINSHDGQTPLRLVVSPVRVVCANTVAMALSNAQSTYSIRHTVAYRDTVAEVRAALRMEYRFEEEFSAEVERMLATDVTDAKFREVVKDLFPAPKPDAKDFVKGRHDERIGQVTGLYHFAKTNRRFHGTAYGAFNAITEYLDHFAPVKGEHKYGAKFAATVRAERTVADAGLLAAKRRAHTLLAGAL